jgi:cell division protein FtsI/penicillin-binding protein 2
MKFRPTVIFILFLCVYAAVSARLYFVQVYDNQDILPRSGAAEGKTQSTSDSSLENRGQIFFTDRSGTNTSVAIIKSYPAVFISPRDTENIPAVASLMAELFGQDAKALEVKITEQKKAEKENLPVADRISDEAVRRIQDAKLKGINIREELDRYYPFRELGSHVVGFVDNARDSVDPKGLYGIEKSYNEKLAQGEDVYLTIDRGIQNHAEALLEEVVTNFHADTGTVIVMNPKTGEILAMASKPDFDPNEYGKSDMKNYLNPAVQLQYEPGSVIKPLTLSAGIDTGTVTPSTTYVDTGSVTLNGLTIHNFRDEIHGKITMQQMIEQSINTGAIYAERLAGNKNFYNYLTAFGLSEKTGVELPGEINGNLRNLVRKDVRAIDFATAAYGQGISITPLELISAYAAIANDGVLMRPYIIKDTKPEVVRRVIKSETAKTISNILVSAVEKNRVAVIPQYHIAGKTGTAFIADPKTGKYDENAMAHSYLGFAPASDPKFVILVKVERPKNAEAAGATAAPVFKKLAEFMLNYYHIPPDNITPAKTQ